MVCPHSAEKSRTRERRGAGGALLDAKGTGETSGRAALLVGGGGRAGGSGTEAAEDCPGKTHHFIVNLQKHLSISKAPLHPPALPCRLQLPSTLGCVRVLGTAVLDASSAVLSRPAMWPEGQAEMGRVPAWRPALEAPGREGGMGGLLPLGLSMDQGPQPAGSSLPCHLTSQEILRLMGEAQNPLTTRRRLRFLPAINVRGSRSRPLPVTHSHLALAAGLRSLPRPFLITAASRAILPRARLQPIYPAGQGALSPNHWGNQGRAGPS